MHTRSLINNLVTIIEKHKSYGNNIYTFQDIKIDNVFCNIEIYLNFNILVLKCKNIFVTYDGSYNTSCKYIPFHYKYDNIHEAVLQIYHIYNNYKFFDGVLMSTYDISKRIHENKLFNISFDKCCICYSLTNEITVCNHAICIICREKLISHKKIDCPICRKSNIIKFFNHKFQSIYNIDFPDLERINNMEIYQNYNEFNNDLSTEIINIPSIPVFELLLVREVVHNNMVYPLFFTAIITHKLYTNKNAIFFSFFSGCMLYFFVFYLKHDYCSEEILI